MPAAGGPYYWIWWFPRWLQRWIRWAKVAPPQPGQLTVSHQGEAHVLRYTINLPPKPAIGDLASREATIQLDADSSVKSCQPNDTSFQFDTDAGVNVNITLVDIDTSGNRSAPSVPLVFTATDTVPPPVPGGMSVGTVEQIEDTGGPFGGIAAPKTP